MEVPEPGWYDDPQDRTQLRWWDGSQWTERRQLRNTAMPPPSGSSYGIPLSPGAEGPNDPWGSTGSVPGSRQHPPAPPRPPSNAESDAWIHPRSLGEYSQIHTYPAASVSFQGAITSGFRNYAVFRGRASRSEYWYWTLFLMPAGATIGGIAAVFIGVSFEPALNDGSVFDGLVVLLILPFVLPSLAVSVRRLHDVGMSGWFILVTVIPWLGSLAAIVFGLIPGQDHANRYG